MMAPPLLLPLALLTSLPLVLSSGSSDECKSIGPTDVLLLLDMQNTFMINRSLRDDVPAEYAIGSYIVADKSNSSAFHDAQRIRSSLDPSIVIGIGEGALAVPGASEAIVDVANEWLATFAGGSGHIVATLDYHPDKHCSFCNAQAGGIAPAAGGFTYCTPSLNGE